jgi:hypothetical protein
MESKMELKEKIKKEIDMIPKEYLPQIERYIKIIKSEKAKKKQVKTMHLKGKFDNIDVRRLAYE